MIVGCYVMDLYCDSSFSEGTHDQIQYTGRNGRECWRKARSDGWAKRGEYIFCSTCVALWKQGKLELKGTK